MSNDVCMVWMFISLMLFFLGVYVGVQSIKNDKTKFEKKKPTDEEIRAVLENVAVSYHCSPHEKDCLEEAIKVFDERIGDNEEKAVYMGRKCRKKTDSIDKAGKGSADICVSTADESENRT